MDFHQFDDVAVPMYQDQIEAEIANSQMSWFLQDDPSIAGSSARPRDDGEFRNIVYHAQQGPQTPSALQALLMPLLFTYCDRAKLPLNDLLGIHVDLLTRTMVAAEYQSPHVDFAEPHHTCLYHVNETDGDTFVFDQVFPTLSQEDAIRLADEDRLTVARRIQAKRGRAFGFNGALFHAGAHPVNHASRIVIAFNFK